MVHDRLDDLGRYLPAAQREAIERFLATVDADTPEGQAAICGDSAYARIMSYPTKLPEDCVPFSPTSLLKI